jgi:hypothetical protein
MKVKAEITGYYDSTIEESVYYKEPIQVYILQFALDHLNSTVAIVSEIETGNIKQVFTNYLKVKNES